MLLRICAQRLSTAFVGNLAGSRPWAVDRRMALANPDAAFLRNGWLQVKNSQDISKIERMGSHEVSPSASKKSTREGDSSSTTTSPAALQVVSAPRHEHGIGNHIGAGRRLRPVGACPRDQPRAQRQGRSADLSLLHGEERFRHAALGHQHVHRCPWRDAFDLQGDFVRTHVWRPPSLSVQAGIPRLLLSLNAL